MAGWVVAIILLVLVIYLFLKNREKQELDSSEKNKLNTDIALLKQQKFNLTSDINELQSLSNQAIERYNNSVRDKSEELENYFNQQKIRRQQILDEDFEQQEEQRKESLNIRMQDFTRQAQEKVNQAEATAREQIEQWQKAQQDIADETDRQLKRYEGLLEPLQQYEKEKQQRLFYTIQVPDEYKDDINFLITTVSQKVQHPDIINKLVWAEYVKPYIDETFKRANIKDEPGIYKITSLENGKSYIGKSTNIKKRIADHFKSSIGIKTIADQAVHHEIWKSGFWNWTIEPIIYCDKDELNDLEKYYIEFFKTQEFGYNKNQGGGG